MIKMQYDERVENDKHNKYIEVSSVDFRINAAIANQSFSFGCQYIIFRIIRQEKMNL